MKFFAWAEHVKEHRMCFIVPREHFELPVKKHSIRASFHLSVRKGSHVLKASNPLKDVLIGFFLCGKVSKNRWLMKKNNTHPYIKTFHTHPNVVSAKHFSLQNTQKNKTWGRLVTFISLAKPVKSKYCDINVQLNHFA